MMLGSFVGQTATYYPPSVVSRYAYTPDGTAGLSFSPVPPSGSVGELLVLLVYARRSASNTTMTCSVSGWTEVHQEYDSSRHLFAVYRRLATGSDSCTVVLDGSSYRQAIILRVAHATTVDLTTSYVASSTSINCPSHTASPTADDYVWVCAHMNDSETTTTGWASVPSGYSNAVMSRYTTNSYVLQTADKTSQNDTEDPASVLVPGASVHGPKYVATIAIR